MFYVPWISSARRGLKNSQSVVKQPTWLAIRTRNKYVIFFFSRLWELWWSGTHTRTPVRDDQLNEGIIKGTTAFHQGLVQGIMSQAPVPLTIFRSNLKFDKNLDCFRRDVCKMSLWSVAHILNQSTANLGRISNSIEISLVGQAPGPWWCCLTSPAPKWAGDMLKSKPTRRSGFLRIQSARSSPHSKVYGANMGPTSVLSAPWWPHEPCDQGLGCWTNNTWPARRYPHYNT